jgi:hypothetical protein
VPASKRVSRAPAKTTTTAKKTASKR